MAAITDPEAIRFVNEQVRPMCEKTRALMTEIASMQTLWYAGLNNKFPNDASPVDDKRETEGVSRLTGADVTAAVANMIDIHNTHNSEIISKPCVWAMKAS